MTELELTLALGQVLTVVKQTRQGAIRSWKKWATMAALSGPRRV